MIEAKKENRPSPRAGITWEVNVGGQKIFLRSGEFTDGTLCEIFLDTATREGSLLKATLNGFAISISLALQHGVPLRQFIGAYRNTKFDPQGPVSGDPEIKWASSIFDYIFHRLELTYLPISDRTPEGSVVVKEEHLHTTPPEKVAGSISTGSGV